MSRELATGLFNKSTKNYKQAFQIASLGGEAMIFIGSFFTGCIKERVRACKCMLPSLLLRSAPYFKSPFIVQPIAANCARIWW